MKKLLCLCALLLIASCSNTPESHYYLLRATATEVTAPCDHSIGIGPVTVAEYLNRPQIALFGEPGELAIEQYQRWGEPLRSSIERVLMENLATLTGSNKLVIHPWQQSQHPRYAVRLNILIMNRQTGRAVLKAQWQLLDTNNNSVIATHLERYESPLNGESYRELVEGFSETLLQLSEQIAEAIAI